MSLFNKKTVSRQTAFPPPADPASIAAFGKWADSIASGRVAQLRETELHGPFMELMIKALGYTGPVRQRRLNARVYALFDLTPEEIALLEASL